MKPRKVTDLKGREFQLTEAEEKYLRAIEKLDKMKQGRIRLFGSGTLGVRINGSWCDNEFFATKILCDGGDGGDWNPDDEQRC